MSAKWIPADNELDALARTMSSPALAAERAEQNQAQADPGRLAVSASGSAYG